MHGIFTEIDIKNFPKITNVKFKQPIIFKVKVGYLLFLCSRSHQIFYFLITKIGLLILPVICVEGNYAEIALVEISRKTQQRAMITSYDKPKEQMDKDQAGARTRGAAQHATCVNICRRGNCKTFCHARAFEDMLVGQP